MVNELNKKLIKLLKLAMTSIDREVSDNIKNKTELSYPEFMIMMTVNNEGCIRQEEIAKFLNISQPAVSRQILNLVKKQFIEETKINSRQNNIKFTKKGEKEFLKAFKIYSKTMDNILKNLDYKQKNNIIEALDKLLKN